VLVVLSVSRLNCSAARLACRIASSAAIVMLALAVSACGKAPQGGWVDLAEKTASAPPAAAKTQTSQAASAAKTPPAATPTKTTAKTEPRQDRIEVRQEGDMSIVNVYRVSGIGGAQVKAPASGWPLAVVVRLHGFPAVESFRATSNTAKLECAQIRPEGQSPRQDCRLGNAPVDAMQRGPDYMEVKLPNAMFAADSGPVELQWVDQWR
jgi:hypothetical protein